MRVKAFKAVCFSLMVLELSVYNLNPSAVIWVSKYVWFYLFIYLFILPKENIKWILTSRQMLIIFKAFLLLSFSFFSLSTWSARRWKCPRSSWESSARPWNNTWRMCLLRETVSSELSSCVCLKLDLLVSIFLIPSLCLNASYSVQPDKSLW